MTEKDIDPLCVIPNINFNPNSTQYVKVRQWAKPSFDAVRQEVVKAPAALVDGVWTQQWQVIELYATQAEVDAAIAADVEAKRLASVPATVTPRQIRQALSTFGLRSAVEDAVVAGSLGLQDWWNYASEFERSNTQVNAMATSLGVTPLQLDDLFTAAGKL